MENHKFSVKVVGIVFNPATRKVLIGRKKSDKLFTFLEGKLTFDEELDLGLKKVAQEKTGYNIKNLGAVFAKNCLPKKDELELYFLCEIADGKEKLGKEITELKWVNPKEVERLMQKKLPTRLREYIHNLD